MNYPLDLSHEETLMLSDLDLYDELKAADLATPDMDEHFREQRADLERVQRSRRVLADMKVAQKELARQQRLARGVPAALGEALARPAPARRENISRYR